MPPGSRPILNCSSLQPSGPGRHPDSGHYSAGDWPQGPTASPPRPDRRRHWRTRAGFRSRPSARRRRELVQAAAGLPARRRRSMPVPQHFEASSADRRGCCRHRQPGCLRHGRVTSFRPAGTGSRPAVGRLCRVIGNPDGPRRRPRAGHRQCRDPAGRLRRPAPLVGDSGQLRVIVANHDDADTPPEARLTIVVAVTDGQTARVSDTIPTTVTMLGVSAGAATSEELARVAAGLAVGGRNLAGLLVVDSNPADETTGRLPQLARPAEDIRPARMTGIAARG